MEKLDQELFAKVRAIIGIDHFDKNHQQISKQIMDHLGSLIPYSVGVVTILSENEMIVNVCEKISHEFLQRCLKKASLELSENQNNEEIVDRQFKKIICECVDDAGENENLGERICSHLFVPLSLNDLSIGGISLFSRHRIPYQQQYPIMEIIAGYLSVLIENSFLNLQHEQHMLELSILNKVSKKLNSILNLDRLLDIIVNKSAEMLRACRSSIVFFDQNVSKFRIKATCGFPENFSKNVLSPQEDNIINFVCNSNRPLLVNNLDQHPEIAAIINKGDYKTGSFISLPLKIRNRVVGVLNINDKADKSSFTQEDMELIETFVSQASIAVENAILYYEMEQLAITDGLTKLYNHKYFQENLEREIRRAERYRLDITLLMIDIDHFKILNDTYGHPEGDTVLEIISEVIKQTVRNTDTVARYGGEEFVVIMPETDLEESKDVANRIRENVANRHIKMHNGVDINVTISIGVSAFCKDTPEKQRSILIDQADQALYKAKDAGRNRVVIYNE